MPCDLDQIPCWYQSFETHRIIQDWATGLAATFLGLLILFYWKPRLSVKPVLPGSDEKADASASCVENTLVFRVKNRRFLKVLEVKARLWRVITSKHSFPDRRPVNLKVPDIFELSGKLTFRRKRKGLVPEGTMFGPKTEFRFVSMDDTNLEPLKENEYLLFQVVAKHGFTGLTRLQYTQLEHKEANRYLEAVAGRAH